MVGFLREIEVFLYSFKGYLKFKERKKMKMTWLHMLFGLFLAPGDSRAKSVQQLKMTLLLFLPLNFSFVIAYQDSNEKFTNLELSFGPYAY